MSGLQATLRDLSSHEASVDPHSIRLCEVSSGEASLASALGVTPAVLVRHMLSPCRAPSGGLGAGVTLIGDLRMAPAPSMGRSFHALDVIIPWVVLDRIAEQVGGAPLEGLNVPHSAGVADPTIGHLVAAILPTLRTERRSLQHYVDQLGLALASHIAHVYGQLRPGGRGTRGGLPPHILRRAQSMLRADLRAPPTLDALAAACGLSARHFARAFRESTGLTPHRWTMRARVATAKASMQAGSERLAEIAAACGFADQSHFTRVFKQEAGLSPAAWRRIHADGRLAAGERSRPAGLLQPHTASRQPGRGWLSSSLAQPA